MAPLEALERDYPIIDSNFRMFCASHGIFTVEDFLAHDLHALEASTEQDYARDKIKQGIAQLFSIIESQRRPWLNGLELLEDAQLNKRSLSTGCERIDFLLQGGLCTGHVTELVGPSSSGKTQVCLKAASHVARKYSGTVMYFDSGNSFSPKRVAQFLTQSSDPANVEVTNHMVAGEAGISKPALGESWKSIPHVRLMVSRCYATNDSCISIIKHPYLATGKTTKFIIM